MTLTTTVQDTARPQTLGADALQPWLAEHPGWRHEPARDGLLFRQFTFPDFPAAIGFMAELAVHAERLDHHPEWFNVHRRLDVTLTTHDGPGVTERDLVLADVMDKAFARFAATTPSASPAQD